MRRSLFIRGVGVSLLCGALLSSCMVGPNYKTPESKVEAQYKKREGVSDRPPALADASWWKNFNDATLDQLVEIAYRNNPTLQEAGVRILQTRAELNSSIGNLFPQKQEIIAGVQSNATTDSNNLVTPLETGKNFLASQAILSVSWEIDFWGKYRRQIQSDRATYLQTVAAYDSTLVTLIADVANSYANIRTLQARIDVLQENIDLQSQTVKVVMARNAAGQVGELDVDQAKTQLEKTQADLPAYRDRLQQTIDGLAVLLGETPADTERRVEAPAPIPTAPASVAVGIPIDLLRRRPDVREAGLEAASQSAKIGVAFAAMLPSFSLNGNFGYSSGFNNNSLSQIFNWQQTLLNSAGSLVVPIFNYGRLINQVRVTDASFEASILNYQRVVLRAQREVEDGLSAFTQGKIRVARLEAAVESARRATKLANVQYQIGTTDYTTVLSAQQQQVLTEDALAATQGDVVVGLITVYRSLGGGWELREGRDVISDSVRAEMMKRTNWGNLLQPSRHLPPVSPEDLPVSATPH